MTTAEPFLDRPVVRPGPPSGFATAARVFEHRAYQYRRAFRGSLFGSFVNPALFLLAMGVGLGGYVNATSPDGRTLMLMDGAGQAQRYSAATGEAV